MDRAIPCSFPTGAGASSESPPAFPDDKRWLIDLFRPCPTWLPAAPFPPSACSRSPAPLGRSLTPGGHGALAGSRWTAHLVGSKSRRLSAQLFGGWLLPRPRNVARSSRYRAVCRWEGDFCWLKVLFQVALKVKVGCSFQMVSI